MTRASHYVVGKSLFNQILLKITNRKTKYSGGRCLSIKLWIHEDLHRYYGRT